MSQANLKTTGFGCPETTDPHRFEVEIPAGRGGEVSIVECYGIKAGIGGLPEVAERCLLPRPLWALIAEEVRREFNERLRGLKLAPSRWTVGVNRVERLLGKELLVLTWAIENAEPDTVPNAVRNWIGLRPEERWWLFNMTAAATGHPQHASLGWRKALRFALTENPLAEPVLLQRMPKRKSIGGKPESKQLFLLAEADEESSPLLTSPADAK